MKMRELIKSALSSIWSRKVRSFLTSLGVIIGVFAISALLSVGQASVKTLQSEMSELNGDVIELSLFNESNKLTLNEIKKINENEYIDAICPIGKSITKVENGEINFDVYLIATDSSFLEVKTINVSKGRFLSEIDSVNETKSAVLGLSACMRLFGTTDAVGEKFFIDNIEFTVIGVMEQAKESFFGNPNEEIYITTQIGKSYFGINSVGSAIIMPTEGHNERAENYLKKTMKDKYKSSESYYIMSNEEIQSFMKTTNKLLMSLLGGIGGISLLVSGIGIMNIMLVSVRERTKEIGIRKAIGAKRKDILSQFLIEAMVLSLIGGVIGIALTFLVIPIIGELMNTSITVTFSIVLLSTMFSLLVGVGFGIYPAVRASKLRPVEALHYQ